MRLISEHILDVLLCVEATLQSIGHVASNMHNGLASTFYWTRHCGVGASLG